MNALRSRAVALLLVAMAGCDGRSASAPASTPDTGPKPQSLPTISMPINEKHFELQVADNDATRETGLMYVRQMPADRGMIFVFPAERPLAFWMKNTPIDLDIIFADHTGKVVSVKTMRAYDTSDVPSDGPATYAIELNAGAAAAARVTVGQMLNIPPELAERAR